MTLNDKRLEQKVSFPKRKDEWHHYLYDHVEDAVQIQNYVRNLPETAATWTLHNVPNLSKRPNQIPRGLAQLTGSWRLPEIYRTESSPHTFVNPEYVHAEHYAEPLTRCECGIPIVHSAIRHTPGQPSQHKDHRGCTLDQRYDVQADLIRERRRVIKEMYAHAQNIHNNQQRLGFSHRNSIRQGHIQEWGVDIHELTREARRKIVRTSIVLAREYNMETIGNCYGVGKDTILKMINKESTSNARDLFECRRAVV